jgi:hypothetical protein
MIGREGWEKQGKTYDAEIGDKQTYPLENNLRAEMGVRVKQHKKNPPLIVCSKALALP